MTGIAGFGNVPTGESRCKPDVREEHIDLRSCPEQSNGILD